LSFRNNINLRPAGSVIQYTEEMLDELDKCRNDPVYFIKKYVKVIHVDRGLIPFALYDYQEEMVRSYHENRRSITMLFRQAGKTTTTAAFLCWFVLFNDEKTCAILANKMSVAREILQRVETAYEHLPKWLQQGVTGWNKGSLSLENGSRIIASATSSSAIRGWSISLLYLDEFAHVENNVADEFFTSVYPTISSGKETKIIMSSTPKGYNHFYKFWSDAEKGINGFKPLRFDWWKHPERDQKWADEQKAVLGEVKYNQEVCMEFLGSSMTLLDGATLRRLAFDNPQKEWDGAYLGLATYVDPIQGRNYVMTVDVSRGRHLDKSAFLVIDITEQPYRIVCRYYNAEIAPMLYASLVHKIARIYNNAYVLIEINDIGAQVADTMYYEFEYENMFWSRGDMLGKSGEPYPGIRTTKRVKRIGCSNLKDIIDNEQYIVNDYILILELSTFIQSNKDIYEADEGKNDDLVACSWLFAWMVAQPWFKDLTDTNIRDKLHRERIAKMEEDLTPFGFYQDGQTETGDNLTPEERGMEMLYNNRRDERSALEVGFELLR
jgi:hypothetical protein